MRLIDGDAIIIDLLDRGIEGVQTDDYAEFQQIVEDAPTVDAVPVVHATLEDMGIVEDDREWVCSNCKAEFTVCVCGKDRTWYIKHCPYCGAMIIGERKGGDE